MNKLEINKEYLGVELSKFEHAGIPIAQLVRGDQTFVLETNGKRDDLYLEIVEYNQNSTDEGFSEPIYEMPKTENEVELLFNDYL